MATHCVRNRCLVLALLLVIGGGVSTQQEPDSQELRLYVNELSTFSAEFAMGNIVVADPTLAGWEPASGRRELLIRGKKAGETTLSIWDQRGVKRHVLRLVVSTREDERAEADLKALLTDYPGVKVQRLRSDWVLTGAVASKADFDAVGRIAAAARAENLVRLVATEPAGQAPPPGAPPAPAPASPAATPAVSQPPAAASPAGPAVPRATPPTAAVPSLVDYEVEIMEASVQFRTQSYAKGVEPSGKSIYRTSVTVPMSGETTVFVGGSALAPKDNPKDKASPTPKAAEAGAPAAASPEIGLRLTLRPRPPDRGTRLRTDVVVETNLPLRSELYDPTMWRRSRWSFDAVTGEPFAVAGADLLAAPDMAPANTAGAVNSTTRGARAVGRVAGVPGVSALDAVPVFSGLFRSSTYRAQQTQLLLVVRPLRVYSAPQP